MTRPPGGERAACAILTHLAPPADPVLGRLLQALTPAQILDAIGSAAIPSSVTGPMEPALAAGLAGALGRWAARLPAIAPDGGIAAARRQGIDLICPGDRDWPPGLDELGATRPYALWAAGNTDLRGSWPQWVAVAGTRAATAYGTHMTTRITAGLAAAGQTIVSGGAFGIDAAAHRAALAAGGPTIAVLACGPDIACPPAHRGLLAAITAGGAVISEHPPGTAPARRFFLLRNRIIAAITAGMVVAEAAERGGTMAAARHAIGLGRPVMAVPGPVTSAASAGCHALLRDQHVACVTSASDVLAVLLTAAGQAAGPDGAITRVPAGAPRAALKAELLALSGDPGNPVNAACADFLATPTEAGDAGHVVAGWLRTARTRS